MNILDRIISIYREYPILIILTVLLFTSIIFRLFRPKIKGYLGELLVRFILLFLNKKEYKVIHDVNVYYNGLMSQIDHVIVSCYGIFVIETKNYKGWIFGSEKSEYWTQVIFNNKYELYNPLRQNLGHVKALKANLSEYPILHYFPIVVFTGGASLKVNSTFPVIKNFRLLKTIKSSKAINITEETRDDVYNLLLRINGIKPTIIPKKYEENKNLCPRCDNEIVLRTGKNGEFYGCSKFPNCRYTKRIK